MVHHSHFTTISSIGLSQKCFVLTVLTLRTINSTHAYASSTMDGAVSLDRPPSPKSNSKSSHNFMIPQLIQLQYNNKPK